MKVAGAFSRKHRNPGPHPGLRSDRFRAPERRESETKPLHLRTQATSTETLLFRVEGLAFTTKPSHSHSTHPNLANPKHP